jgi:hypothetical protein
MKDEDFIFWLLVVLTVFWNLKMWGCFDFDPPTKVRAQPGEEIIVEVRHD